MHYEIGRDVHSDNYIEKTKTKKTIWKLVLWNFGKQNKIKHKGKD